MEIDRPAWPSRLRWIDVAWVLFSVANLVAMLVFPAWETVPFHFIWVSLTLLYGFRVWSVRPTLLVLACVMVSTALLIGVEVAHGDQPADEITEVPLMAAMFVAMMWHAQRRLTAMEELEDVSMANSRLLERERQFLQDASHELRTPITVALGHAELIQRSTADPTNSEDAAVIIDELLRLRRLADRLLLLAGSEDPDFLHLRTIDVESLIVDAVRRWTATPRRWLLETTDEATVLADGERLAVALDALIENAVDHTQEADTIEIGVRRRGGNAIISVRDTGTGIPPADLPLIFHRFARADAGRSRHTGGFGLGLPIVKAICEAHGGTVSVRSTEGKGTTFEISLPVQPASETQAAGRLETLPTRTEQEEDARELAT